MKNSLADSVVLSAGNLSIRSNYEGFTLISRYSEVGIAPHLGCGDRVFEPHYLDHTRIVGESINNLTTLVKR